MVANGLTIYRIAALPASTGACVTVEVVQRLPEDDRPSVSK